MKSIRKSDIAAVGVTGGIGTGKTEVCGIFASLGANIISADNVARDLIEHDPVIRKKVAAQFGDKIYLSDGTLDRKHMAKLIFFDQTLREKLNALVHPSTLRAIEGQLRRSRETRTHPFVMVEAALLYETKADRMFDYMVVVDADEELRIQRVMKRDQTSREEVLQRIRAQSPNAANAARADFVIQNNGSRTTLQRNCSFVFMLLTKMCAKDPLTTDA